MENLYGWGRHTLNIAEGATPAIVAHGVRLTLVSFKESTNFVQLGHSMYSQILDRRSECNLSQQIIGMLHEMCRSDSKISLFLLYFHAN